MARVIGVIDGDPTIGLWGRASEWKASICWTYWSFCDEGVPKDYVIIGFQKGSLEDLKRVYRNIPEGSVVEADLDFSQESFSLTGRKEYPIIGTPIAVNNNQTLNAIAEERRKPVIRKERGLGTFTFGRTIRAWTGKLAGKPSISVMLHCGEFDFEAVKPVLLNAKENLAELIKAGASYAAAYSKEWVESGLEGDWNDAVAAKLRESLKLRTIEAWPEGRVDLTFSGNRNLLANHEVTVQFSPEGKPISGELVG